MMIAIAIVINLRAIAIMTSVCGLPRFFQTFGYWRQNRIVTGGCEGSLEQQLPE
ncbi:MAG: hypothetical protein ABJO75_17685 [Sedimentitalea sp.]|uniref:hypothetical protein n=1 Tax=Sedimentitalea sp. TaxID=2048915 RepID=UPI0032648811